MIRNTIPPGPLSRASADEINRALELLSSINRMSAAYPMQIMRGFGQQPLLTFDLAALDLTGLVTSSSLPTRIVSGSMCLVRDTYGVITGMRYTAVDANGLTTCNDVPTCVACGTVTLTTSARTYPGDVAIASRGVTVTGTSYSGSGTTNSSGIATFTVPSSAGTITVTLATPGSEASAWDSTTTPAVTTTTGTGFVGTNTVANTGETAARTNFRVATGSTPPPAASTPAAGTVPLTVQVRNGSGWTVPVVGRSVTVTGTSYTATVSTNSSGNAAFNPPASAGALTIVCATPGSETSSWQSTQDGTGGVSSSGSGFTATNTAGNAGETFAWTLFQLTP